MADRVYVCSATNPPVGWEVDQDTLANLSGGGVNLPGAVGVGIGGIAVRLYLNTQTNNMFFEIDPDTLANLSGAGVSGPSGAGSGRGIGGMLARLFHTTSSTHFEIDPDTLANLSGGGTTAPGTAMNGIGGTSTRLFALDDNANLSHEIDPDTLGTLNNASVFGFPRGCGGTTSRLYGANNNDIHEIDLDDFSVITGPTDSPADAGELFGMGATMASADTDTSLNDQVLSLLLFS